MCSVYKSVSTVVIAPRVWATRATRILRLHNLYERARAPSRLSRVRGPLRPTPPLRGPHVSSPAARGARAPARRRPARRPPGAAAAYRYVLRVRDTHAHVHDSSRSLARSSNSQPPRRHGHRPPWSTRQNRPRCQRHAARRRARRPQSQRATRVMLMGRSGQTAVGTLFYEKLRRASPRSVAQREARARRGGARGAVGGELGAATYARRSSYALRARPRGGALSRFRFRFFKITQSQYLVSVLVGCFLLVETGIPLCNALRKSHEIIHHAVPTDYWLLTTGYWLLTTHPPPLVHL